MNEELYELENYKGSGLSSFLKDQSKKFIKKAASSAVEKAVNTCKYWINSCRRESGNGSGRINC